MPLFFSNYKIIGNDLSNCRWLHKDANVISGGEKIVGVKIQQHYHPKVIGAQDGTNGSLTQVVETIVEFVVEPMMEPVVEQLVVEVQPVAQSQFKPIIR